MRVAYADPPYIGQAKKHYKNDASGLCEEVDHAQLIQSLMQYDAWALSASSVSLAQILPMCPAGVRVMAWVKPFCVFKPGVQKGTHGAKPFDFCLWLFQVLDLQAEDEFHDLYPGSGAVTKAWEFYRDQLNLQIM